MEVKFFFEKQQQGQTLVEYILLLVVAVSLVLTLYRSQTFRRLFGQQGAFGQQVKVQGEFSYRHAFSLSGVERVRPSDVSKTNRSAGDHPSYSDGSGTRFFGPKDTYGQ